MQNLNRPWTAEEDRRLMELRAKGRSSRIIGEMKCERGGRSVGHFAEARRVTKRADADVSR